jgi:hypothetical protein
VIDIVTAIGLLANVGVLAGIVFLAIELRQNTLAVRSEASQGIQGQIADLYSLLTTDRVADIYRKGTGDPDQLDPTERVIFNSLLSSLLAAFENLFALVNEGSYDESRARGYWQVLRNMLEYPGTRQHWERTQFIYNEAFREHVESEVMTLEPLRGTAILPAIE